MRGQATPRQEREQAIRSQRAKIQDLEQQETLARDQKTEDDLDRQVADAYDELAAIERQPGPVRIGKRGFLTFN